MTAAGDHRIKKPALSRRPTVNINSSSHGRQAEALADFIAEARAHASDMLPVIQRDYLQSALDKLETQQERVNSLFDAIAHGDPEHRGWLQEAIDNHFRGLPVPPERGGGTKADAASISPGA